MMTPKQTLMILTAALMLIGCESTKTVYVTPRDTTPPSVPRGVSSITGDEQVEIVWFANNERDLAGYVVYRSTVDVDGPFDIWAEIVVDGPDHEGYYRDTRVSNGRTYYYAVTAYDRDGNESDYSFEDVFDTPRPAGYGVLLDADRPVTAGFDFSAGSRAMRGDSRADIEVERLDGSGPLVVVAPDFDTDIQDFGITESLDDLDWAPANGWSSLGWCELIVGHSYVVWTNDDHYAKFRVTDMDEPSVLIDWAYQPVDGYQELKPAVPGDSNLVAQGR